MNKFSCYNVLLFICVFLLPLLASAQPKSLDRYNVVWTTQSKNSSESMPCGGHDIGLNVWVENGDLLFYVSRSGTFDENNGFLKLGRVRVKLSPNPFENGEFRQELKLHEGYVEITGKNKAVSAKINLWVDVMRPVVHVSVNADKPVTTEAVYESWRYENYLQKSGENFANSLKWGPVKNITTQRDSIAFRGKGVEFFHHNLDSTVFDITVRQQGLWAYKDKMYNPLKNLTFGGCFEGKGMSPAGMTSGRYVDANFKGWVLKSDKPVKNQEITLTLHTLQTPDVKAWQSGLEAAKTDRDKNAKTALAKTRVWWNDFWNRSFIEGTATGAISKEESVLRNFELFRYQLGCNAFGSAPTKFNGGLFTYDAAFTDPKKQYTPDFRNWCGGLMTAQNQRLVYFPFLKNGDFEMMKPQFDYYKNMLGNAELRSEVYWGHKGACFTEQIENFGLPNSAEYGWKRPENYDKGMEYNAWLEYLWDTSLEFCFMILEKERYTGADITEYLPLIRSCLTFFDEHYQYLAKQRGAKALDDNGHLVLYPGSGAETFKMAYNASSTIAALKTVTSRLLELPDKYLSADERKAWSGFLQRIPPIEFAEFDGHKTIAPARAWMRVQNEESPQLYPVFPWGMYGVGKPDLDVAINTWNYDPIVKKFRSPKGWKQDNIWAARLGLTEAADTLLQQKLGDSPRRFPSFWGPGFDWTPDHNWGGSGMIGLQEMLMQVDGKKIYLLPAWPKSRNVHFKLHAPYNTTVEATVEDGKLKKLEVLPAERKSDVQVMNGF
ncbi:DUF5703 domain-containing protein [Paludibacter jiangxiensis]|uniref:DUF5703 domain-containing protein n=1 Tax=Paludibacter jiangxiensis TaxID=681398 RepID=A0A171AUC0_9BACT|nr:DUF5703 domain-containing protein [Paludibacter jiangxiensis]GAT64286.1 hypothetical protein PJIAN_4836 [Paludibacter jiangxiensis]